MTETKLPNVILAQIVVAFTAIDVFKDEKLDPKISSKLIKIKNWMSPFFEQFHEVRDHTLKELGVPDEKTPGQFTVPTENVEKFNEIVNREGVKPVMIPNKLKLSLSDLDGIKVAPGDLSKIAVLFSDLE